MARTPQEIFAHHAEVLIARRSRGDRQRLRRRRGLHHPRRRAARQGRRARGLHEALSDVPNAEWDVPTQIFEGDVLFIEWCADGRQLARRGRHRHVRLPRRRDRGADRPLHVDHVNSRGLRADLLDTCQDRDDEAPPRGGGRARRPRALPHPRPTRPAPSCRSTARSCRGTTSPSTRRRPTAASRRAGAGRSPAAPPSSTAASRTSPAAGRSTCRPARRRRPRRSA